MKKIIFIIISLLVLLTIYFAYDFLKSYDNDHFNIEDIKSINDFDNDGIDDYRDIMLGARMDALNKPKYQSAYYAGGYPPDDEGVCTDVIWRAFKNAGYSLKDLVDADIKENPDLYYLDKVIDSNIDFRRVQNLQVFFERKATKLTTDLNKIEEWQQGDIVVFGQSHIGIISDKRNRQGIPFLIHNDGTIFREANVLKYWNNKDKITGHYRWDG